MKLKDIYKRISELTDLTPSKEVNMLFSTLVAKAVDPFCTEILTEDECSNLQKICSHAEYEMEKYWAQEIIVGNKTLVDFPYYTNYRDLTRLEWNAVVSCADHSHHDVLFIGSGPLPMTAISLALNHNVRSVLVDNDETAVTVSREVLRVLNLEYMITVEHSDGNSFEEYKNFNVIFVAALAGSEPEQKEKIFEHLQKKAPEHCHIVARSSWGNRTLLYPSLPKQIYRLFKPLIEISPYNEIVNSIVIFKNEYK